MYYTLKVDPVIYLLFGKTRIKATLSFSQRGKYLNYDFYDLDINEDEWYNSKFERFHKVVNHRDVIIKSAYVHWVTKFGTGTSQPEGIDIPR